MTRSAAELRHRIAALLVGVAASIVGLSTARFLQQDACLDAGGRWLATARECVGPAGTIALSPARSYAIGAAAGLITLVVLWRTFAFFSQRRAGGAPGPR